MKHQSKVPTAKRQKVSFAPASGAVPPGRVNDDYESVAPDGDDEHDPEWLSVAGFFRRLPWQFHMDEQNRFGNQLGKTAEAHHIAYLTQKDRALGVVRVFPVPMMLRVYEVLAPHQKWPAIMQQNDPPALEDTVRAQEVLGANERAEKVLECLTERIESVDLLNAVTQIREYLRHESERIRLSIIEGENAA